LKTGWFLLLLACYALAQDFPVVAVDVGANHLLGRPLFIATAPPKAEGAVKLKLTLSPEGAVVNAEARGGPEELRETASNSARMWRFLPPSNSARVVEATVFFGPPPSESLGRLQVGIFAPPPPRPESPPKDLKVESIVFRGVSEPTKQLVLARIGLHVGDLFTSQVHSRVAREVRSIDKSLHVSFSFGTTRKVATVIIHDGAMLSPFPSYPPPTQGKNPRQE